MLAQKTNLPCDTTRNIEHGRGEIRRVYVCPCPETIEEAKNFSALNTIIMVERICHTEEKTSTETRFYICSVKNFTPKDANIAVRGHWGIENGLHWQLDFTFKEDDSQVRKENAPANLHLMRKWALFMLHAS